VLGGDWLVICLYAPYTTGVTNTGLYQILGMLPLMILKNG